MGIIYTVLCVLEQERQRERREQKMRDLLEDYFYRSDHVEVQWEDQGRDKIMKHSFVKDMDEEDWWGIAISKLIDLSGHEI